MAIHTFTVGNITVTVTLPAFEEAILADQVISPANWIEGFTNHVSDKIATHKKRILEVEIAAAIEAGRVNQLAATDTGIVQALFNKGGYKNRAQREAE